MTSTFVLVHGSNANSFSWAPLQRELALRGHRSLAVDLPGHGFGARFPAAYQAPQDAAALATTPSNVDGVTLDDNVRHVVDVVRRVRAHGPVVLVGHSLGGMTLTGLGNVAPELVDRLVYISAWCCVAVTAAEYTQSPEFADSLVMAAGGAVAAANPLELGAIRANWRSADPEALAVVKAATMADGTDDEFLGFLGTLQPDESFLVSTSDVRADAATWGRIPRTYVRLTRDRSIPVALQDRFIAEADALTPDNPFDVRSIAGSHAKFLADPAEAADILASLVAAAAPKEAPVTTPDPQRRLTELAADSLAAGDPTGWFEQLYVAAAAGEAEVPWDRGAPHQLLAEWAQARSLAGHGRRALVVGAGLGRDAEYLAGRGFATVAFDISATAVETARARHPESTVDYVTADLLAPPAAWRETYDLVVESMTVQALPDPPRRDAIVATGQFVAPGGTLLVIAAARDETEPAAGPPWPLVRAEIDAFATGDLRPVAVEGIHDAREPSIRRWRAEFRRPAPEGEPA